MNEHFALHGLTLTHERVDDIPLLFGLMERLGLSEVLDRHLNTHASQQGLRNGWLAVVWLAYILNQGDHRKCSVQQWADHRQRTLESLLGQPIRPGIEFSDDRLEGLLCRLSRPKKWHSIEADLWQSTLVVYDVPVTSVRLDSTTTLGYHSVTPEGVMQLGHSKDHRPDLPQVKIMAACAQPTGYLLGTDVLSGERADDRLYVPLIDRVRKILGRTGLLYAGDCKMAALETRADIVAHHDHYLVPLPLSGETAVLLPRWIEAAVGRPLSEGTPLSEGAPSQEEERMGLSWVPLLYDESRPPDEQLLGAGYEFERPMCYEKVVEKEITNGLGQTMTVVDEIQEVKWTERVQIIRSRSLAEQQSKRLEQRLSKAQEALLALTPPPGRGRRQFREEADLQAGITQVLQRYEVTELLGVSYEREEVVRTSYVGRGRGAENRPTRTTTEVRYQVSRVERREAAIKSAHYRLGWRVQVTSQPASMMSLEQTVVHYRLGSCLEQDFHMLKDLPVGISPLYVRRKDQIVGLTHLLMLALRLLLLIQMQVRQGLEQTGQVLSGLYEGQPTRTSSTPTAVRLLKAVARQEITLTRVELGDATHYHLTPLSGLLHQLLGFLKLSPNLYARLAQTLDPAKADLPTDPSLAHLPLSQNSS